jgi:cellulose synthase (UDP-forming)
VPVSADLAVEALAAPDSLGWAMVPVAVVLVWALGLARRPEQRQPLAARRSAVVVLTLLGLRYLNWRVTATLNLATPLSGSLSLLLLAAEVLLLGTGFLHLWLTWARQPPIEAEADAAALALVRRIDWEPRRVPAVDVLVPSYGEPAELIERCLRGCRAMDYPRHSVWLLDDSGREELSLLCDRLGCRYLSRPGERRHAKAGNLNHALPRLEGDLVAVFDADVVPQTGFLKRTVGLFADPHVGFVQTPQSYMNADPVIRNLRLERWLMPDEESFYRWIEPTRQAVAAVVCAGTSFVMRRSALLRVGGFETATPSEDLATGIRLAAAGCRNLYLNEKLSAGLAPLTIGAMARQRSRWASGTLQTLRTGANPLRIAGLTPLQRLAYLEGILHWFNAIPQLLLLLLPLSVGLLAVPPLRVSGAGVIGMALPFYLGQLLLVGWFSRGSRSALLPELYRWIFLIPVFTAVCGTVLGQPQRFRVTPKAMNAGRGWGPERGLLLPLLVLLGLQLLNLQHLLPNSALDGPTRALGLTWGSLSVATLLVAVRLCWDRPGSEAVPWFTPGGWGGRGEAVVVRSREGSLEAELLAISETGLELRVPGTSAPTRGQLVWPGRMSEALPIALAATRPDRHGMLMGARWDGLSAAQREVLQGFLYRRPELWPTRLAPFEPRAWLEVLGQLLRPVPAQGWFRRSVVPMATRGSGTQKSSPCRNAPVSPLDRATRTPAPP